MSHTRSEFLMFFFSTRTWRLGVRRRQCFGKYLLASMLLETICLSCSIATFLES